MPDAETAVKLRAVLASLLQRLAEAVSADELAAATRDGEGVTPRRWGDPLRVVLELDPPAGARELCAAWGIARPVAVSMDVEQRTWSIFEAGEELPDPYARRIASAPITAGRWTVVPRLAARPAGDLPPVVSGASPAYDIKERGGVITSIEVVPMQYPTRQIAPDHPSARALLDAMRAAWPAWRGNWAVDPAATFVALYDGETPLAGAALAEVGDGLAIATEIAIAHERTDLGAPLLDALETAARERGATRIRLDSSAFLLGDALPWERYGYAVGPPYAGDTDVEVWAEKPITGGVAVP